MQKVKRLRKSHGIYPILGLFNLGQLPLHLVYIGLINKLATDYTIRPETLTEGLFWFKDLSAPDPYGILPVLGGTISLLNLQFSSNTASNPVIRKMKRFIWLVPCLMIPVWMTFPVVSTFALLKLAVKGFQSVLAHLFSGAARYSDDVQSRQD